MGASIVAIYITRSYKRDKGKDGKENFTMWLLLKFTKARQHLDEINS